MASMCSQRIRKGSLIKDLCNSNPNMLKYTVADPFWTVSALLISSVCSELSANCGRQILLTSPCLRGFHLIMSRFVALAIIAISALSCDLEPSAWNVKNSWLLDTVNSDSDPCLTAENCLGGPGERTVLRFASYVSNIGTSDCTLGYTPKCPANLTSEVPDEGPFHYDKCHKHWHVQGLSVFKLFDLDGNQVGQGMKNGLCLMDVVCPTGKKKATCFDQGISPGCIDIYDNRLDCQWIDITDVVNKTATYKFRWESNTQQVISETNYDNNVVELEVDLSTVQRVKVTKSSAPNQCTATSIAITTTTTTTTKPCTKYSLRKECRELKKAGYFD